MIIGNVKSNQDLESKRNLQKEILALEVSNEEENQRRRKQAGIQSYEPAKILAQYKTSAEIQLDRMSAEAEARKHLDELGFGFQDANKIVAWLSSSIINRLTDFNANAKGIKSEIKNNFSPTAYTNVQFIENFLERYFDDLDVNFGKKFGLNPVQQSAKTIDELQKILPNRNALERLKTAIYEYGRSIPKTEVEREEELQRLTLILNKINVLISCSLSPQMISELKSLLSQNERAKFSKRVSNVVRRMNLISTKEIQEITGQIESRIASRRSEIPAVISKLEKLIGSVGGKGFVNLTEFTEKFLQEVGAPDRPEYQQSAIAKEIEDNNQLTEINLNKLHADEVAFLRLKTPRIPRFSEARYYGEITEERDPISILHDIEENGFTKLQAVYRGYKGRQSAESRKKFSEIVSDLFKRAEEILKSEEEAEIVKKEIFEDITGNVDKSMTEEEMKEEIKQFLVENPSAPERIDTLLESVREEQASIELEEPSIEQSIQLERNEYTEKAEQYLRELREGKNSEEYKSALKSTLNKGFNVPSSEYKNLGVSALENLIKKKYSEMNPLARVGRKEYKPEGVTTGLGLRRQRINQKLAKHFKEDEKLLKKVVKKLSEDSSSDEEEEKLLKGHIRRSAKADREIEHSLKGEGAQFLPKSQRDAIYSGLKKMGLGSGKLDANTFKFLGNKDKWHEAFSGVGFHAKRIPINKVGKGVDISEEENPTYRTFGKYRIHIPQLLNNNTANFKYPSLGSIPTLKPQTISQDYKEFLIELLNNGKFSDRDLKRLPQREIKHFERVAIGAGLVEKFGIKVGDNEEDRKDAERFEVLKGEYLAGNNNEKMIKELRQLIVKFINSGRLIKSEGMNLLLQISTL